MISNPFLIDWPPVMDLVPTRLGRTHKLTDNSDFPERSDRALSCPPGHTGFSHDRWHGAYASIDKVRHVEAPVEAGLGLAHFVGHIC